MVSNTSARGKAPWRTRSAQTSPERHDTRSAVSPPVTGSERGVAPSTATPRRVIHLPLKYFSPRWMLLFGFGMWLVLRVSVFYLDFEVSLSAAVLSLLAAYVAAFVAGTAIVRLMERSTERVGAKGPPDPGFAAGYRRAAVILSLISLVFMVLRFYDLLYGRGLLTLGSVQEVRMLDNVVYGDDRVTSGVGFISGTLYPITIPTVLLIISLRPYLQRSHVWGGVFIFALYAGYVMLSGNRYILVSPLLMCGVAFIIVNRGWTLTRQRLLAWAAAALIVTAFVSYVNTERDRMYGVASSEEALEIAPERKLFSVSQDFLGWMKGQPLWVQDATYAHINVAWYYIHGLYEFEKIWHFADPEDRAWGAFEFSTALYLARMLGFSVPSEDIWRRNLPTFGFYMSFFGPVYIDFGIGWGILFCLVLGMTAELAWIMATRHVLAGLLFYPFVASVIFNMPNTNLIMAALGLPIIGMTCVVILVVAVVTSARSPLSPWAQRFRHHSALDAAVLRRQRWTRVPEPAPRASAVHYRPVLERSPATPPAAVPEPRRHF